MDERPADRPSPDAARPSTRDPEVGTTPATGTTDERATHVQPVEEPNTAGTLFITLFLLMIIFGFWAVMYYELLNR